MQNAIEASANGGAARSVVLRCARLAVSVVLLWALLAALPPDGRFAAAEEPAFASDSLVILTQQGAEHAFTVELALTPQQRAHGLMFRREMAADAGMLFLFAREAPRSFWMKNTYLPLDILYLDREGRIVSIAADTTPLSETPIPSGEPAMGVLELNAGTAARLGIAPGDRVVHRAFSP